MPPYYQGAAVFERRLKNLQNKKTGRAASQGETKSAKNLSPKFKKHCPRIILWRTWYLCQNGKRIASANALQMHEGKDLDCC